MQPLKAIFAVVIVCYPLVVYFGLSFFSLFQLSLLLLTLIVLRLVITIKTEKQPGKDQYLAAVFGAFFVLYGVGFDTDIGIKFYPVIINTVLAYVFAKSLISGPSAIEKLARLKTPELSQDAILYTRGVTKIWLAFFVINGSIAAYTAILSDMKTWALYNGLISYVLMGVLFAVEFIVRLKVQKAHGN